MTGEEEIAIKTITSNYLKGRFSIDLLSTIPFEKFASLIWNPKISQHLIILSCMKLIRILKLSRLIDFLNSSDEFKLQLKLLKMMFFLLLYVHFSSCLWLFISGIVNELQHPELFGDCKLDKELGFWLPPQWESFKEFYGDGEDEHFYC